GTVQAGGRRAGLFRGPTRSALVMLLTLVSFGVGHQWSKLHRKTSPATTANAPSGSAQSGEMPNSVVAPPEEVMEVREEAAMEANAPAAPRRVEAASRASSQAQEHTPASAPSPLARQLVQSLTQLDFTQGPFTAEQANLWKENLQQLV